MAAASYSVGYTATPDASISNGVVPTSIQGALNEVTIAYDNKAPVHLTFVTVDWNNQTTDATSQGFEVEMSGSKGTWVKATAVVSGLNKVVVTLPKANVNAKAKAHAHANANANANANETLTGIRYAWQETPTGQQLYTVTKGELGVPAMGFFATCSADGSCTLATPGAIPSSD